MGWIALVIAACAAASLALPAPGIFFAIGLAVLGLAAGAAGYRRRAASGAARLAGAAALTVAGVALLLAVSRYILTLVALGKLESLVR